MTGYGINPQVTEINSKVPPILNDISVSSLPLFRLEARPVLARPPSTTRTTGQQSPLPQILVNDLLHASQIVLRFTHVVDPGPPLPLGRPLRNLHTLHERAVDLDAHLDGDLGQVVAQQYRRGRAGALDRQDDAGERLAGLEGRVEDVADFGAVQVCFGEEAGSGARRVQQCQLLLFDQAHRVFTYLCRRDSGFVDEDFSSDWGGELDC